MNVYDHLQFFKVQPLHLVGCFSPGKLDVTVSFETSLEIGVPNQSMLVHVLSPSRHSCNSLLHFPTIPPYRDLPPLCLPRFVRPLFPLTTLGSRDLVPSLILPSCLVPPPPLT